VGFRYPRADIWCMREEMSSKIQALKSQKISVNREILTYN
jgi:hypothetical protein